ncbi:uncharacterized protein BDR25DRAFT_259075 [Lindgomyces ingoldianus]|uniref:Uncharacterized protein n=1 Tax=Lindgomyces ingoldianus TaxID=673940 RepID=A0ACB6R035_9PLEO|nr:uncharacterized protein BDR25DRAFT_259075 [Lindgomyces ingoldianus]KAF2472604.1 hypothetical protein BDR25DRAFT_259075 [Lindgomyces ingoldianus]
MAGSVLNMRIITKSISHTLRAISVVTFPPGFLFLLIQGIASGRVNPAIGILPLFCSSAFSAFLLYNERKCGCQSSGLTGTPIHFVADFLLGIGLLVCLILAWVFLPHSYDGGMVMLGTYCTNFLGVNFLVHFYFTVRQLYDAVTPGANYVTSCPHCKYGPSFLPTVGRGSRKGYAPLLDGEGRPMGDGPNEDEHADGMNTSTV